MAIRRHVLVLSVAFVSLMHGASALSPRGERVFAQTPAVSERGIRSHVVVTVPAEDAELVVEGKTIPGQGATREFDTGPLDSAATHRHSFTVTWKPNAYTTMTRSKTVAFRAGEPVRVDLSVEDPADRVRVIYHPTPADVAETMVDLAAVTRDDVVYEPGCGDARVTIAAIRRGARRAICVDIDPDRATESRENVESAGFARQIDVRLGDALDLKDLSEVTVVFLYMGDHFNLLLRPILWRDLKVGSRIVSHRFTMGDWAPDKTVTVPSADGGEFELHVWTITEDIKRRLATR